MVDSAREGGRKVVYRATGLSPLYMVQIVACAFCVAGLGLAWHLWQAPRHPLTPSTAHAGWASFLALLAAAAPVVAWVYGRGLVAELRLGDDQTLWVRGANLLFSGWRAVPLADVAVAQVKQGDAAGEQSVSPTRLTVAVRGGRGFTLPLGRDRDQIDRLVALIGR